MTTPSTRPGAFLQLIEYRTDHPEEMEKISDRPATWSNLVVCCRGVGRHGGALCRVQCRSILRRTFASTRRPLEMAGSRSMTGFWNLAGDRT